MLNRIYTFFSPQAVQDIPSDVTIEKPYAFENCPDFKNIAITFKKLCQKRDELATAAQGADEYLARSKFLIVDSIVKNMTQLIDHYHKDIDRSLNEDDKREWQTYFLGSLISLLGNAIITHDDTLNAHRNDYKQAAINTAIIAPSVAAGLAASVYGGLPMGGATFFGTALVRDIVMTKILKIDLQAPASTVLLKNLLGEAIQAHNMLFLARLHADHETLSSHRQLI